MLCILVSVTTEAKIIISEQERLSLLFDEAKPDKGYFDPEEFKIPDTYEFRMTQSVFLFHHIPCGEMSKYIIGGSPKFYDKIRQQLEAHALACEIARKSET